MAIMCAANSAFAHGDVHKRIDALTEQLESQPRNATLLSQRGTQYALDENWDMALRDFEIARQSNPGEKDIGLHIGEMLLHLNRYEDSERELTAVIRENPSHTRAYELRASVREMANKTNDATADYDKAISLSAKPKPHLYVARAQLLVRIGKLDDALGGIEQGVAQLGPLASLIEPAVDAAAHRNQPALALTWINRLPDTLRNSPRWRVRSGELSAQAGRTDEARTILGDALAAIEQLPTARRDTEAMTALRDEAQRTLNGLAPTPSTKEDTPQRRKFGWPIIVAAALAVVALFWVVSRRT